MSVRSERQGRIATIVIDRPDCRNAVDGPTAAALAQAFRDFEADDALDVAVLWGAGGTFCAGADLKAVAVDPARANRVAAEGDGPMGISRITDVQNGLALAGDFMSAATFLGLTGLAFMGGVDALQFAIGGTVGWAIILFIVADRLRNLGRFTFADVVAFRLHPERLRVLDHAVERLLAAFGQELGVFVDLAADDHAKARDDVAPDETRAHDVAAHQPKMLRDVAALDFERGGQDHARRLLRVIADT